MNKKEVVLENTGETKQFGMLVNAKSFGLIVSGIYSHKIRAVIREYTTNCIDSHLMDGHSKPYDCHIPTYNNPTFWVRDYGVGLDEDDIVNVFTVAFASTKESTRISTGFLGIGSMSAFCYNSKSFTVTSWKNGIKYIYHMYLDATDAPCYTKLLEEKSDEPTGVKVEFPVKTNDIYKFEDDARNVFMWQEIKPNLVGGKIDIPVAEKLFTGTDWYLTNSVKNCSVLMGGVLYDVEVGETSLAKFNDIINSKIVLEAPIGSVDFQPSRERLQYTPKTISFLRKMFLNINREVLEAFEKDVKNAESLWDAKTNLQNMLYNIPSNLTRLLDMSTVEWNGIKLHNNPKLNVEITHNEITDLCSKRDFICDKWRKTPKERFTQYYAWNVTGRDFKFVIADVVKGVISKIKHHVQEHGKSVSLFIPEKDKTIDDVKQFIIDKFGCLDKHIILSSSIPDLPKRTFSREKLSSISLWYNGWRPTQCWRKSDLENVDITDGVFYYVVRHAYDYVNKNTTKNHQPMELKQFVNFFNDSEKANVKVYGVAKKDVEDLPDNWVEFTSLCAEKLEIKKDIVQKYLNDMDYYWKVVTLTREYDNVRTLLTKLKSDLPQTHKLMLWLAEYNKIRTMAKPNEPSGLDLIKSMFGLSEQEKKIDLDCSLFDKYKLLLSYDNYYMKNSDSLDYYYYILGVDAHG